MVAKLANPLRRPWTVEKLKTKRQAVKRQAVKKQAIKKTVKKI
jgi:hypothetical protein